MRGMRNVLFYSTGEPGDRLQEVLQGLVPKGRLEVYKTLESFSERLRKPMVDAPVAVVLAASEDDLLHIFSIGYLLYDVRFILVLPDREGRTAALGHSLRPRFLSYADSDFGEVRAVLGKMIGGFYDNRKKKDPLGGEPFSARTMTGHDPHGKKFVSSKATTGRTTW